MLSVHSLLWGVFSICCLLFIFRIVDNKAGRSLALLLIFGCYGWRNLAYVPTQQPFQSEAALTAAEQTIDEKGRISVRPVGNQVALFHYFQVNGAAQLRAVQPLNEQEWLAVFAASAPGDKAPVLDDKMRGWFERKEGESNETLPLVTNQKAIGGDIRVEDATSGETLFAYQANGAYKPVAIVKQKDRINRATWQVVFSNQPGLLSQPKASLQEKAISPRSFTKKNMKPK